MKKIHAIAFLLALALLVAGCGGSGEAKPQEQIKAPMPPAPPEAPAGNLIEITSAGFSPQTLTINAGEKVTWINKGSDSHWPASAMHPTHTAYPGSDISKCGSSEEDSIFDACKGVKQGETFEFTFNEKGTWKYHDHLNPSLWGTIVVE